MGKGKKAAGRDASKGAGQAGAAAADGSRNTCAHVQVLGANADVGGVPAAILFFDHRRFLFNVPEGFQRYATQHKVKLTKISHAFLTRTSMETAGGLPGMLLTLADSAKGSGRGPITLGGPEHTKHLLDGMGGFMNMQEHNLHSKLFSDDSSPVEVFKDESVTISAVTLKPGEPSNAHETDEADEAAAAAAAAAAPEPKRQRLSATNQKGNCAVCYIAKLPDIIGKFLPQKAAELGVPKGPLFGRLVKGEPIELPSGETIRPEQVMTDSTPGPMVVIADCPTPEHLPALSSSSALRDAAAAAALEPAGAPDQLDVCVVHLTPREVVDTPEYKAWMRSFGSKATHLMAGLVVGATVMESAARLQATLNSIDGTVFPLHCTSSSALGLHDGPGGVLPPGLPANAVPGRNLHKFHLRPAARIGLDESEASGGVDLDKVREEKITGDKEMLRLIEAAARHSDDAASASAPYDDEKLPPALRGIGREVCEISFLGTGSAVPSKYRNVTGLYVNLFGSGGLMLDCGEDSYGQLVRRFGPEGADRAVAGLKLVWISHIHADHHVGLSRILLARQRALGPGCPPLALAGPWTLRKTLESFRAFNALSYRWIDATHLLPRDQQPEWWKTEPGVAEYIEEVKGSLGLKTLQNVRAVHCAHSFGVVLEGASSRGGGDGPAADGKGWKVVFSGDTRPCPQMVAAAQSADLLIHEATFDDDMAAEAQAKRHSMTSEAVGVGAEAGAFRTLLTHFSQRYPKIPVIAPSFQESTCIAFDLMSVNLADVSRLPALIPPLERLFKDGEDPQEAEME